MVERQPSKLNVEGSNPFSRSQIPNTRAQSAHIAQMVERVLGKDEVISSILIMGSRAITDDYNVKLNIRKTKAGDSNG